MPDLTVTVRSVKQTKENRINIENTLYLIENPKGYVDFGDVIDGPGWAFLSRMKKLSPKYRFCIVSLAQNATDIKELTNQAGMFGATGLSKEVKLFWRTVAYKVIADETYNGQYKTELDKQYKKNQKLSDPKDISYVKYIARQEALYRFLVDLLDQTK